MVVRIILGVMNMELDEDIVTFILITLFLVIFGGAIILAIIYTGGSHTTIGINIPFPKGQWVLEKDGINYIIPLNMLKII